MSDRIKVAFVDPPLRPRRGDAAPDPLLSAWRDDPDIDAWLARADLPLLVRDIARADVVHIVAAPFPSFLVAPLPAMLIARAFRKPVVLNHRSGEVPGQLQRSVIARTAIGHLDKVVVPSRYLVEVFHGFGIDAGLVPNFVDLQRFRFRDRDPLRPRLLSVGEFDALHNVAATIRAFKIVQDRWSDASLTLVGGGPQEADLRALVAQLRLRHVTFAGLATSEAIAGIYADHDIYVQSPNIDHLPTSVFEAFASGLPVVSTEAGGVPPILTHGVHGWLAPLADYQTLGHHVLRLLANPAHARALARAAYATCHACTWPEVRGQWLRAYRSMIARVSAPVRHIRGHHDPA